MLEGAPVMVDKGDVLIINTTTLSVYACIVLQIFLEAVAE